MKKNIKFVLFISLTIILLYNCNRLIKKQIHYLLPNTNSLELISKKEIGITNYNIYKVNGKINIKELSQFPKNVMSKEGKAVIKWHKPTNEEIKDFRLFVKQEQSTNKIATKLARELPSGDYFIALIYDEDKIPMGKNGYSVDDWIDLYFFDLSNRELIYINYGKF